MLVGSRQALLALELPAVASINKSSSGSGVALFLLGVIAGKDGNSLLSVGGALPSVLLLVY